MALKDRIQFLTTPDAVDEFLRRHPDSAIFKAGSCHKTPETFARVRGPLEPREDLALGVVRVTEARPASQRLAELTGVRHESPQLFLFKDGRAVFNLDNWDITGEAVAECLAREFPTAGPGC